MSQSKTNGKEEAPRQRVPFGGRRQKLQLSEEDAKALDEAGWKPRWVNNKDGRIQQALAGGYEYVKKSEAPSIGQFSLTGNKSQNGKVSMIVSKGEGQPLESFLMKIKKEYYFEDKAAKARRNDELDGSLISGQPGGNVVENQYVPKGHTNKI